MPSKDIAGLRARLRQDGPDERIPEDYKDGARLWEAMIEWLDQFEEVVKRLAADGLDVLGLVREQEELAQAQKCSIKDTQSQDNEQSSYCNGSWGDGYGGYGYWPNPAHNGQCQGHRVGMRCMPYFERSPRS